MSLSTCCLCCVMGIPGSGKSFLCSQLSAIASQEGVNCRIVEFDVEELESNTQGVFSSEEWRAGRKRSHQLIASALSEPSDRPTIVLVDDVCDLRSMRRELYVLAREGMRS